MILNIKTIQLTIFFLTISLLFISYPAYTLPAITPWDSYAQYLPNKTPIVKRQLRGTWISTIVNLDWPSSETRKIENDVERIEKSKNELIVHLDKAVEMNLNAVFFQVSPSGDAFFKSKIVPWSRYLTGTFGKDPGFDPLDFIIKESHNRNLEIHAWFNPYRLSMDMKDETRKSLDIEKSVYKEHPEWIKNSMDRYVVDPGIPEARKWVINRVMEVVDNYDVDGVHFDDYFYYENLEGELKDENTFKKYNYGQFKTIGDFRRNNTYLLVKELSAKVRSAKSWVKFGISPSGIWGNKKDGHSEGSNTNTTYTNYEKNFADTKRWVVEELIDYIAPQIYFSFANTRASYGEVASWWANVCKGKKVHLYIGQALYKINEDSDTYFKGENALPEFSRQLKFNVSKPGILGTIVFRVGNFFDSKKEFVNNAIKNDLWSTKALIPIMPWKGGRTPTPPINGIVEEARSGLKISWTDNDPTTSYYAIYRFNQEDKRDITMDKSAESLIAMVKKSSNGYQQFFDIDNYDKSNSIFVVTALDRLHHESNGLTISIHQSKYFADVGIDFSWAFKEIDLLYEKMVVKGAGEGFFHPKDSTKRGDFILMIMNTLNLKNDLHNDLDDNFIDVPKGAYYYNAIRVAKELGIVKGYNGFFKPTGNITREDMMVILVKSLEVAGINLEKADEGFLSGYYDAKAISGYAKDAVSSLVKAGYIKGSSNKINPKQLATRAECAVLLERIIQQI